MKKILVVGLPKVNGEIDGLWYNGFPIHFGDNENSLNYATVYAGENNILPDQKVVQSDHKAFLKVLKMAGFELEIMPFPEELNQLDNLHHDAVFVRDAGFMFDNKWIVANFSVKERQVEAEVHSRSIQSKYGVEIVDLPKDAKLEFGEVIYLETKSGSYYFGGVSRSNEIAHDFVRDIVKPDNYIIIKSSGYHLDTVFSPVLSPENEIVALLVTKGKITDESIKLLQKLEIEMIYVDQIDSSGKDMELGNYAINTLIAPGVMVNCAYFETEGVEEKLKDFGVKRFVSSLTYFRFAGGSYHCLTNEIW